MAVKKQKSSIEVEEIKETIIEESEQKKAYRELIEKYAEQNPVKYAEKKAALEEKLNAMK